MISLPDALLARVDDCARQRGTTRSGFLRDLAERELDLDSEARLAAIRELLGAAGEHGGGSARQLRDQRRSA